MKNRFVDTMPMKGRFRLRAYRAGKLVETWEDKNLIVDGARRAAAELIAGVGTGKHIAGIAFGTRAAAPTPDDTEITEAFVKKLDGVTFPLPGQACFSWRLDASEANGMDIIEFGLLTEDGTLWARKVREKAIPKAGDIALEGEWIISH